MGIDYPRFPVHLEKHLGNRSIAENFRSAEKTVIFEVVHLAVCPGIDVELMPLYLQRRYLLTMHKAEAVTRPRQAGWCGSRVHG
jgi:hypothetical protein